MSASREKRSRQTVSEEVLTERKQKRQQEEKAERRSMMTYTVVGVIVVLLSIFLVIWNNGIIQRNMTAVEINGTKYSPAAVQYYMTNVLSQYGMSSSSTSLKSTVMDETTGETLYDFFLEQAIYNMVTNTALAAQIEAEGYTISQAAQEEIDTTLENLDTSWSSLGYTSLDAFLRANFGPYMTRDLLADLFTQEMLVSDYTSTAINALEYSDSEYNTYYQENADNLDTYTITQFVFQAKVATTDAEGNTIEMTDEEKAAALEEAKAAKKAVAEELLAKLDAGEDAEALAEEYDAELYSSAVADQRVGSSLNSAYSEWAMDSSRKYGDTTLSEYDSTSVYNYYVVRFESREQDNTPTDDVRHILVADEETAQSLLDEWKAGEATEASFSALASQHSTDTASAADGGLISGIAPTSSYVESFRDWAVDASRKPGDTGLVESTYGWHIMYYVGEGYPSWKQTADSALRSADYSEWVEAAREGYEATTGLGIKFVQG